MFPRVQGNHSTHEPPFMPRRLLRRLLLVLPLVALPAAAGAQVLPVPQLRIGQRVRVELSSDRPTKVEGLLMQASPELLTIVSGRSPRMQAIATTQVRRLSVSEGRRISGRRTLLGLTLGPVVGAALGMGVGALACGEGDCLGPEIGLVVGGGVGLVGGGIWGVWPRERWHEVPMR